LSTFSKFWDKSFLLRYKNCFLSILFSNYVILWEKFPKIIQCRILFYLKGFQFAVLFSWPVFYTFSLFPYFRLSSPFHFYNNLHHCYQFFLRVSLSHIKMLNATFIREADKFTFHLIKDFNFHYIQLFKKIINAYRLIQFHSFIWSHLPFITILSTLYLSAHLRWNFYSMLCIQKVWKLSLSPSFFGCNKNDIQISVFNW
jgi:hypothetical protein